MKILIISHNPISTINNNGKTMLTLFSSFKKEELCQLYIYPSLPDVDKCASYFRITDKDILKSYYQFKVKGKEITSSKIDTTCHMQYENIKDEKIYRNFKNKHPIRLLLRDTMWRLARWYNKGLDKWIQREQPTHIFIVPGQSKFLYDIAEKIAQKIKLPIISYICDDYYFVKKSNNFWGRIQQKKLKKKISNLMKQTSHVIAICDELNMEYSNYFNVPSTTVMTGSTWGIETRPKTRNDIRDIVYMGNIRCNRFNSLAEVGRVLDLINKERKTDFQLKIYTIEKDKEILNHFEGIDSIKLCGFVSGEKFKETFHLSDVLLHVEAFDENSIDLVKHSVSTKIADCLGSGICLFAYGPDRVASIAYLKKSGAAIVCTEQENLKECLLQVFYDREKREQVVQKALITARENHDCVEVGNRVYQIIKGIGYESSSDKLCL